MSTNEINVRCPICNETSPQGYLLCPFCGADLTATYQEKIFAPITFRNALFRMTRLVVKPRAIAREIAENPDAKGGFLFIIVISLSLAIQLLAYIIHTHLLDWKFYPVVFILAWIALLILPTIIWFLGSWTIRSVAKLLGGKATRKQIRAAVGYGLLPVVFSEFIIGIFLLVALPWRNPDLNSFTDVIDAMIGLRNSFTGIVGIILHFAGFLAAIVYIIFITKPASDFSWLETALSVSIPAIVFIILMITYYAGT